MIRFLCIVLLFVSFVAGSVILDSFSKAVGAGGGISFASNVTGRISGVKVWEDINYTDCITGIQLLYESNWSNRLGRSVGPQQQINLFKGETIVQISGNYYYDYIYKLVFVTSRGRSLIVGAPYGTSFNFYPLHQDAELQMLSGRFDGWCITSLAAQWAVDYNDTNGSN